MNKVNRSALGIVAEHQNRNKMKSSQEEIKEVTDTMFSIDKSRMTHHEQSFELSFGFDDDTQEIIVNDKGNGNREIARIDIDTASLFTKNAVREKVGELINKYASNPRISTKIQWLIENDMYLVCASTYNGSRSVNIIANKSQMMKLSEYVEIIQSFMSTEEDPYKVVVMERIPYLFPTPKKQSIYTDGYYTKPLELSPSIEEPYGYEFNSWYHFNRIGIDELEKIEDCISDSLKYPNTYDEELYYYKDFVWEKLIKTANYIRESILNSMSFWDKKSAGDSYTLLRKWERTVKKVFGTNSHYY